MDNKSAQLEFKLLADRALGVLHHLGVAQRSEAIHYFVESLRVKYPDSYEQVRQKLSSNAVTNSIKKEEIDLYNVKKEEQQANSVDVTVGVASAADGVSSNSNSSAATDLNQNFEKILCKEEFMCIDDEDDIDGEEEDDIEDDDESSSSPPQHRIHRLHQIHRMDSSSSSSLLKLHEDESAAMVRMPFNAHFQTLADPLDLIPSSVIDTKNPMLIGGATKSSSDRSVSFTVANISSRDIRLKRTNPLSRLGGGFTFHPESSVAVHYNQRAGEISIRSFKEQFRCRIKFALNHHHKPFLKEIYKNLILTGRIDGIKPPQRALPAPPPKPDHSLAADDLPSIGQCQNVVAAAAAVVVVDEESINGISTEQIEPTYNSTKLVLNNNNNNTNLNGISVLMSKEYNRNNNLNEFSTSGYHRHHHLHHTHPHPNLEENSQTTNTEDSSEDATNLTAVGMDTNSTAGSILNSIEGDEIDLLSLEHQHAPGHMMLQQQQFYDPHQQQMLRHQFEQNSNNPEEILMMQQQGHAAHALLDDEEPKESTSIDMGNGGSSEGQSTSAESGSKKGKPSYNCLLCPKSYRKRKSLLDHYKIHPGYCHDCGKPNGHSLEEIINHNRTVHVKEFPFVCETCGESYSRRQQFHAHVESHNKKEFKTYSCVECGQKFPHKKLHQQHLEDTGHKADGAICEVCGAEFPSKNALYQHVIRVHKKDNFFECHICQNRFTLKANLERHVQLHTEIKRTYVCDLCGSSYFTYPALKDHCSNAHTDASECKCPLCGKRFGSAKSLQRHLPSHSEERPHSCCYCEQTFKWKTHLVRHKQTMHGNQPSPKKGKRFAKCDEELIPMDIPGPPPAKMPKKSNSSKPKQQKAIVVTNTPTPMPTSTIQQSSKEQQLQPSLSQQQVPPPPPSQQQQQQQPQQQQQQQHQQQQQQQPQQAQHHQQQQQYVSSNSNSSNNSSISHQLGGGESQNSIYNHSFNADNLLGQQCNQPTPPPQPLQQQQQQHHQQQQQQQLLHRLTPNADNSNLIVRLNSFNSGAETQFHFDQNAAGAYQQQQQQLINQYQQQQQQHQQHMRSHTPQSPQHQSLHHQQQLQQQQQQQQQQQNSHFAPPHHMLHQHQLHHQQSPHQHHRQHQRSPHHHQQQQQQQQQQHQQLQQQHQQSSHSSPQQHHQQTTPLQSPQPVGVPVAVAQPQPPQQQQQQTAQSQSSHHHQQQQYPCASIQQQSANPNDWSSLNFPTPTPTANNPTNQQQQNPTLGGGGGGTGGSSLDAKDNSKFYSVIHVDPDFLGLPLNVTNPGQQQPPTASGGGGVKQTGATPGHDQQAVLSADIMNFQNMWPQNTQPQQMAFNSATQPVVPSGQADAHNYNNIGSILTNLDIIGNNNPMEYNFELLPPPAPPQQNNSLPGPQQQHHPYANAAGLLRHTYDYPNHTLTDISEQKNTFQSYHQPVAVVTPPSGYDPQPVPGARVYGQQADETKTVLPPISEYMHHAGLQPPPQDVNLVYYPVKNE